MNVKSKEVYISPHAEILDVPITLMQVVATDENLPGGGTGSGTDDPDAKMRELQKESDKSCSWGDLW